MRGITLSQLPVKDLRETVFTLGRNPEISKWPKAKCIEWLNEHHKLENINVRNLCLALLRVVVEKNSLGFPVGLSCAHMAKIAKTHFPYSAVTSRHFSWYATSMRSRGEVIPVYREGEKK